MGTKTVGWGGPTFQLETRTEGKERNGHNGRTRGRGGGGLRAGGAEGGEVRPLRVQDHPRQDQAVAVRPREPPGALEEGMGFDGSSITGFNRIEESDMVAMPDPSTFKLLPWRKENPVGRMFCDVLTPSREPYEGDPRYVMKRALDRAADLGFDHYYLGPE